MCSAKKAADCESATCGLLAVCRSPVEKSKGQSFDVR